MRQLLGECITPNKQWIHEGDTITIVDLTGKRHKFVVVSEGADILIEKVEE